MIPRARGGAWLWIIVLVGACRQPAPMMPVSTPASAAGPRSRFVVKVETGTFSTTLDTRLESELLFALARQPDLEVISSAVADRALTKQHACDPEHEYAACRVRQLGLAGDFLVELEIGAVPGTWLLTTAVTPAADVLRWLPTLPFSPQRGESLEEAVVRAARLLGASLGPHGLRPGTVFPSATAAAPDDLAAHCANFNAPWSLSSQLAWQTRMAVRAQLHQLDREPVLETALVELKAASKPDQAPCQQLAALIAWQQRAISRGWLPATLNSETWRANIDIELRAPGAELPVSQGVANSLAGAFATRGVTLRSVRSVQDTCAGRPNCVDGFSIGEVQRTLWLVAGQVDTADGKVAVSAHLFVPGQTLPLRRVEVANVAALKPAIDAAVRESLALIK